MLYRIIIGELTWDESNGDTDNQVDGQEDQLTYHQLNPSSQNAGRHSPF